MITKMTANKKINILEFKHLMEYKEFKYLKKFMMYISVKLLISRFTRFIRKILLNRIPSILFTLTANIMISNILLFYIVLIFYNHCVKIH